MLKARKGAFFFIYIKEASHFRMDIFYAYRKRPYLSFIYVHPFTVAYLDVYHYLWGNFYNVRKTDLRLMHGQTSGLTIKAHNISVGASLAGAA